MAEADGRSRWPNPMAEADGRSRWPKPMAEADGRSRWPKPMAKADGQWLKPMPLHPSMRFPNSSTERDGSSQPLSHDDPLWQPGHRRRSLRVY